MHESSLSFFLFKRTFKLQKTENKKRLFKSQTDLAECIFNYNNQNETKYKENIHYSKDTIRIYLNQVLKASNQNHNKDLSEDLRITILELIRQRLDPTDSIYDSIEEVFDQAYRFQKRHGIIEKKLDNSEDFEEFKLWQNQSTRIHMFNPKPAEINWIEERISNEDENRRELITGMFEQVFSCYTHSKEYFEFENYLQSPDHRLVRKDQFVPIQFNFYVGDFSTAKKLWEALFVFLLVDSFGMESEEQQKDYDLTKKLSDFLVDLNGRDNTIHPIIRIFKINSEFLVTRHVYFEAFDDVRIKDKIYQERAFAIYTKEDNLKSIIGLEDDSLGLWKESFLFPLFSSNYEAYGCREVKFSSLKDNILSTKRLKSN